MKAATFALLISIVPALSAGAVRLGDPLQTVKDELGAPRGQLDRGGRHVLYFDRGEVELRAGVVSRIALLSVEEFRTREAARAAVDARSRAEMAERRAKLVEDGERIRAAKQIDPIFQAAPISYQVTFWQAFARHYPDVSCDEQLAILRARYAEQLEASRARLENEEKIASLEARIRANEAGDDIYSTPYRIRTFGYYGGSGRHPVAFWPIEYHFNDPLQPNAVIPIQTSVSSNCINEIGNNSGSGSRFGIGRPEACAERARNVIRNTGYRDSRQSGRYRL